MVVVDGRGVVGAEGEGRAHRSPGQVEARGREGDAVITRPAVGAGEAQVDGAAVTVVGVDVELVAGGPTLDYGLGIGRELDGEVGRGGHGECEGGVGGGLAGGGAQTQVVAARLGGVRDVEGDAHVVGVARRGRHAEAGGVDRERRGRGGAVGGLQGELDGVVEVLREAEFEVEGIAAAHLDRRIAGADGGRELGRRLDGEGEVGDLLVTVQIGAQAQGVAAGRDGRVHAQGEGVGAAGNGEAGLLQGEAARQRVAALGFQGQGGVAADAVRVHREPHGGGAPLRGVELVAGEGERVAGDAQVQPHLGALAPARSVQDEGVAAGRLGGVDPEGERGVGGCAVHGYARGVEGEPACRVAAGVAEAEGEGAVEPFGGSDVQRGAGALPLFHGQHVGLEAEAQTGGFRDREGQADAPGDAGGGARDSQRVGARRGLGIDAEGEGVGTARGLYLGGGEADRGRGGAAVLALQRERDGAVEPAADGDAQPDRRRAARGRFEAVGREAEAESRSRPGSRGLRAGRQQQGRQEEGCGPTLTETESFEHRILLAAE